MARANCKSMALSANEACAIKIMSIFAAFKFVDALVHARTVHDQLLRSNKLITRALHGSVKLRGHLPRQVQVKGGTGNRHEADANFGWIHMTPGRLRFFR